MKFIKDILFVSLETTGADPDKDNIIQLAAVLLDKDNLLEKNYFNSYVRVSLLDGIIHQHATILNIPFETMQKSRKVYDAIKQFDEHFSSKLLLATNTPLDLFFLKNAYKKAVLPFDFDHHVIDLWTIGYLYTLGRGITKMPTFHTFVDYFGLKQKHRHNALEKCRLSAEIFRKIIKSA